MAFTMDGLIVRSRAFSDGLRRAAMSLEDATWADLGYLNYSRAHREYYDCILDEFADLQLCLVDIESDRPVALANCVPIACSDDLGTLPARGWDWIVESAATGNGKRANALGALAISVPQAHRGKGYATRMIRELRMLSERSGFEALVAPVRPTAKCNYPRVAIDEYIEWRDSEGRIFDPWLRRHLSEGGQLIGPCEHSMVVEEHVAFWETWAGRHFDISGDYVIDGALVPVSINLERQIGRYEEPNVWVAYAS